jgi:uncharacterized protein (DUF1800 family)
MKIPARLAVAVLLCSAVAARLVAEGPAPAVPRDADDRTIIHVLNRIGFGPTSHAVDRVKQVGLASYIDQQLHPERIADEAIAARLAPFTTLSKSSRELAQDYFMPAMMERREQQRKNGQAPGDAAGSSAEAIRRTPEQTDAMRMQRAVLTELTQQRILRAAYSDRQLEEVLVDFWFNHFNVFAGKGQVRVYLTEYERDVIRPHVFGKFRDLLGATAQAPAMLFYLDNWQSTAAAGAPTSAADPAQLRELAAARREMRAARNPNVRRARENQEMLRRRQAAAMPQNAQARRRGVNENYARELMELHTLGVDGGYTQKDVQEVARCFTGWTIANPRLGGEFRFVPALHDDGEKIVLGHRIKAGGGRKDGEEVLDLLARHPSTARFIATKLARRFVSDNPPAALVDRAAERFRKTDGDLREVVRTIVTSPEFFAASAYRAKVKNPFEFIVSAIRVTEAEAINAMPLAQALRDLGMPLYGAQPPTGYVDRSESWVNTGALLNRMNFAVALTGGQMRAVRSAPRARGQSADDARRMLLATALAGDVSPATEATVARATTAPQAMALILGSPEFQKR